MVSGKTPEKEFPEISASFRRYSLFRHPPKTRDLCRHAQYIQGGLLRAPLGLSPFGLMPGPERLPRGPFLPQAQDIWRYFFVSVP